MTSNTASYLDNTPGRSAFIQWVTSTDHKRIGILYLTMLFSFFTVAVFLGFLMKLELMNPGRQLMDAQTYNALFTVHGVTMIFLFIIPGIPAALGNFILPLQIGARDVAFPKLNLLSWYLYMLGAIVALVSLFINGTPPDTGWTFYVPFSVRSGTNVTMAVFGAFILGFSSILTGVNFITTVHRMRAPGMTWFRMPLFVWALYSTAWIQILATPILAITLLLIMAERVFGLGIFDPARGGDPILYQHLFWIYSHPAVYIMILPAMGIVSEIVPTFSKKDIFGYKAIVFSSLAIAFVGYLVWGHHMFTSGMSDTARWVFSLLTFIVAIPSGVKVFNWVATLYKGSISFAPPFAFVMMFVFLFSIGGLTGLINGSLATDVHIHDTAFVVAHFHYVMFGGTVMAFFAGLLYWFPKITGKMYSYRSAYISTILIFIGFNMLYLPMFFLGVMGMPRRYYDYVPRFHNLNIVSTIGSWILIAGLMALAHTFFKGLKRGVKAESNPWEGTTLEWMIASPPPVHNFDTIPTVTAGPYRTGREESGKSYG